MKKLDQLLQGYETIGITGHIRPDGDCVGSCLALYAYIRKNYPSKKVEVYLESFSPVFQILTGADQVITEAEADVSYDLFFVLDTSDEKRMGRNCKYYELAKHTVCLDHHISNKGFCDENMIEPDASSTCQVLFEQMEEAKIDKVIAEALYTGIVHDTGMFRHSSTTPRTMEIAGHLMEYGIDFHRIIADTYMKKTYVQNQVLGRALLESIMLLDGTCIASVISQDVMEFYGVDNNDLEGIIDQLKATDGVECAIFLYQTGALEYKVSLRSEETIDVSEIALHFGGGGHKRAAGCTMQGTKYDILNNLIEEILKQKKAE